MTQEHLAQNRPRRGEKMRPTSAGSAMGQQKSRLQIKVGVRGLCRRTEPRDADIQMQGFLKDGTVPVLSFKASPQKVQASLVKPLQAVRTDLMGVATGILDRVVRQWGCMEEMVEQTRGEKISRRQAEEFFEEYLINHNVPGKLQIRWVDKLNSGGKLQEHGRRNKPTARKLTLWISSSFAGVQYSRSMTAFADHEICTHAVRAINDHAQVWVNHRRRYGLCAGSRERLGTEEGLASLNSLMCYPSQARHLWSAAMLYYCAVKGEGMGFGELHKHLIKYVRCPAKRYWYCIRTKGKRADLHQPGSCGKGQVYLEGSVNILREIDRIDFHLLYSGRVPLSKLYRVKNVVRSSLVTLPGFVQDQAKYKGVLRQIGLLNGIISEGSHPGVGPKQSIPTQAKILSPNKRPSNKTKEATGKKTAPSRRQKRGLTNSPKDGKQRPQQAETSPASPQPASGVAGGETMEFPEKLLPVAPQCAASPEKSGVGCKGKSTSGNTQYSPDRSSSVEGVGDKEESASPAQRKEASGASVGSDERGDKQVPVRLGAQREEHHGVGWGLGSKTEPPRPRTLPPSRDCRRLRLRDHSLSARISRKKDIGGVGRTTPRDLLSSSPIRELSCGNRPRTGDDVLLVEVIWGSECKVGRSATRVVTTAAAASVVKEKSRNRHSTADPPPLQVSAPACEKIIESQEPRRVHMNRRRGSSPPLLCDPGWVV